MIRILYIEDSIIAAKCVKRLLKKSEQALQFPIARSNEQERLAEKAVFHQFEVIHVSTLSGGLARLEEKDIEIILLDLGLTDSCGLETFAAVYSKYSNIPIIVFSGFDDEETAIQAVRKGAQEYLVKGQVDGPLLTRSIRYAIERHRLLMQIEKFHQLEHYMAYYDSLTNLPNRQLFYDRLRHAISVARRNKHILAILFIDLDGFKNINDTFGHESGDFLLKAVAERLQDSLRQSDTTARLGGDEFTVILGDIGKARHAAFVARKILKELAKPFQIAGKQLFITASIGISLYPADGSEVETLVKNADKAMYQAKSHGKSSYKFFDQAKDVSDAKSLALESSLRLALQNNELSVFYQPQIDLLSGETIGLEALLRWDHPEKGLVTPAVFLSAAEETGLIIEIGEWLLNKICEDNRHWQDRGFPPVCISMNLSARQFQNINLVRIIEKALAGTGLPAQYLGIEISESDVMKDVRYSIRILKLLKSVGLKLSIDDFGTGYSSLSYLKKIPIDVLKIDNSFIRDINSTQNDKAIAAAVVALGHGLGFQVIAEGVETREQISLLQLMQCDAIQGFYISPPVRAEHIAEALQPGSMIEADKV